MGARRVSPSLTVATCDYAGRSYGWEPPFRSAGHAGSIPVARSRSLAFLDLLFLYVPDSSLLPSSKPAHTMFLQLNCNPRT